MSHKRALIRISASLIVGTDDAHMQQTEYQAGSNAPEAGLYEELNIFGTPTGTVILMADAETFPSHPVGFTYRPLTSLSVAEIRDRAAQFRAMARTATTAEVRDALFRLATRFDDLAVKREAPASERRAPG